MGLRFIILILFVCPIAVYGQHMGDETKWFESVKEELDLSPWQQEKMTVLREKYTDLFRHVMSSEDDIEIRHQKRKELQSDLRQEMQDILTPSQQRELRQSLVQRRNTHRPNDWRTRLMRLELTADQQIQIKELLDKMKPEAERIRRSNMSDAEKREAFRELNQKNLTALSDILTEEQFEFINQVSQETRDRSERFQ